jgi:tRNA pseudouridine13 synthase
MFITTTPALKARVKQRYADFIVEEVYAENEKEQICKVDKFTTPFCERSEKKLVVPENTEEKEHLILELEKINTDTNTAIALLSRGLGLSKSRIGYAGMKDKRAITAQRISIYGADTDKIERFGAKGLGLKNPSWGERLELGDLKGNQFTLTLRDISASKEDIKKIVDEFAKQIKNGIPNFFGTQRFGGKRNVTHRVGKLLLQENFKDAVMLYLTETFEEEKPEIKNARINLAKTLDFKQALREFPNVCRSEKAILNELAKNPTDFMKAFGALQKKTRYLFVHAYQSYLFNKIIGKRIELFGEKALEKIDGDVLSEDGVPTTLLPGFESTFSEGKAGEIEKQIMKEEKVSFKTFRVHSLSELSSKGNLKEISLFPKDFKLLEVMDDEFNDEKRAIKISFFLSKGNYATTALKELIKEEIF